MKPSIPEKFFSRGQAIYRAGEPVKQLYLLQSGVVSLELTHASGTLELIQVVAPQILGMEALWDCQTWASSAIANNEVRLVELTVAEANALIDRGPPLIRLFMRSLLAREKNTLQQITESRLLADPTPCPPSQVIRLFASLYYVAKYTGTRKPAGSDEVTTVVWPTFRKYAQQVFQESPVRLEQTVQLLAKLGISRLEMVKSETDPDAPEELGYVHFDRLEAVREFYEFYRAQYYSGNSDPTSVAQGHNREILEAIKLWNEPRKQKAA